MPHSLFDPSALEAKTQAIGRELFQRVRQQHTHLTTLNRWTKQVLGWCLADPVVKTRVLGFIDVLPSLHTPGAIVRHMRDYFPTSQLRLPSALRLGVSIARSGLLTAPTVSAVVHQVIEHVAKQFIAASTVEEAGALLRQVTPHGVRLSFDILGEQVVSEREAELASERYVALITQLSEACRDRTVPAMSAPGGPLVHVSVKPSSLTAHFDPLSVEVSIERALHRLLPIATVAADVGASITLDMEQYALRDLTLELAKRLLTTPGVGERLQLGVVIQAYLVDAEAITADLLRWLQSAHRRLSVRLVKGAYWDYEVAMAQQRGWTIPVYLKKEQTDQVFERLTAKLLSATALIDPAIASHNLRSIAHAMAVAESLGLDKAVVEFQLLYGMGDTIQAAIRQLDYPVRVYSPLGALIPGMAYLVRRILENTANESFIRQESWDAAPIDDLLRPPMTEPSGASPPEPRTPSSEPFADVRTPTQRARWTQALAHVRRQLGRRVPLLIGAEEVQTGRWMTSTNPAHPDQVIGEVAQATHQDVERAVSMATQAQRRWGRTSVDERVALLRRTAELLRAHRDELTALEVLEVGKPWREADADLVEAIDYVEYYSAAMQDLEAGKPLLQRPGESNRYRYLPVGVCAVIAPWNFPVAILTGMASAALAAGNVVILKPAEQSPVLASRVAWLFREAGMPDGVVQYLPGSGEEIGAALVQHPSVHLIMFTGSKGVGLAILQAASAVQPGQRCVKRVVTEMGGKNALLIDEDADLDAAIHGIIVSAFSYQGQKCSAASRVLIHAAVYEVVVDRLVSAVDGLIICDPTDFACDLGPLIDQEAHQRVTTVITQEARSARLLYRYPSQRLPAAGHFVGPALFADVDPHGMLAQRELFGPVVCLFRVPSVSEAIRLANDTEYGLTGGIYSRSPAHIKQAIEEFEVGTLYVNRPITGAIVGRQPFGGHKLSGLGTKAGGPDYLLQALIPQTVCENTARHGIPLESTTTP